jgi:hypothetical protein
MPAKAQIDCHCQNDGFSSKTFKNSFFLALLGLLLAACFKRLAWHKWLLSLS